jgi:hypothetical protein
MKRKKAENKLITFGLIHLAYCIIIYRRINLGYALSKLYLFYNISTVLFFILPKQIIEKENCSTL